jgi:hypothetical protein
LYIFLRASEWKILVYFWPFWNIVHPSGIFYDHLVDFMANR